MMVAADTMNSWVTVIGVITLCWPRQSQRGALSELAAQQPARDEHAGVLCADRFDARFELAPRSADAESADQLAVGALANLNNVGVQHFIFLSVSVVELFNNLRQLCANFFEKAMPLESRGAFRSRRNRQCCLCIRRAAQGSPCHVHRRAILATIDER